MAASSDRTFADILMVLSTAPFLLWWLILGAVWLGWQPLDLTTGMIFFVFGALAYLGVLLVGGGSAVWAVRHAKSRLLPLHPSSRRLVGAIAVLLIFPWVVFLIRSMVGVLRAW
jgi:hypothetical protein